MIQNQNNTDTSSTTDTIYAIATGQGGALGIIRLSGPHAIEAADAVFRPHGKRSLAMRPTASIAYGTIVDEQGETVDDVVVSIYRAPHSYTGEDCIEISCHNSSYILQTVMQLLSRNGCRLAHPGEYTQRAFMNGKMDLSQAEGVADLIAAQSAAAHRLAIRQMKGNYSAALKTLRDKLLHIASLMELELDFSDHEDLQFADRTTLKNLVEDIQGKIRHLASSFRQGNVIKNGIPVTIAGPTNVGKSTLLNALLGEERAIVSNIQGTTRDVIEDTVIIDGLLFRFIDTAGIRETQNEVERIGIERTYQKMSQAEILLWMTEAPQLCNTLTTTLEHIQDLHFDGQLLLIANKADLLSAEERQALEARLKEQPYPSLIISARTGEGIENLSEQLVKMAGISPDQTNDVIVTNQRHYEALMAALQSLTRVHNGLDSNLTSDLIAEDLRDCIYHLNDIIGEFTSADVLNNIFSHFCIGK
jgi:tRNA modification GTPase